MLEVVLVLVVTCDQSHVQQLPYILSNAITLKLNQIKTQLGRAPATISLAVNLLLPSGTRIFGGKTFHRRLISGSPAKAKPKESLTSDYDSGDIGASNSTNSCSNSTEH